jgi:hypothetical protein
MITEKEINSFRILPNLFAHKPIVLKVEFVSKKIFFSALGGRIFE